MRRGPVQDRTVPLQRQQTLSTARRHSLSELFQLLYDFVPRWTNKTKKRGPSRRKEKDLQRQRLLTLFLSCLVFSRMLRVREASSIWYEGSLKIQIEKSKTFLLLIRPFPNLSFSPYSIQWRTSQFLRFPTPLAYSYYILLEIQKNVRVPNGKIGSMISFFDRPVRRSAWLYSYMFRLAGHYGYSGMASQRGGVLQQWINFSMGTQHQHSRVANQAKNHRPRKQGS